MSLSLACQSSPVVQPAGVPVSCWDFCTFLLSYARIFLCHFVTGPVLLSLATSDCLKSSSWCTELQVHERSLCVDHVRYRTLEVCVCWTKLRKVRDESRKVPVSTLQSVRQTRHLTLGEVLCAIRVASLMIGVPSTEVYSHAQHARLRGPCEYACCLPGSGLVVP